MRGGGKACVLFGQRAQRNPPVWDTKLVHVLCTCCKRTKLDKFVDSKDENGIVDKQKQLLPKQCTSFGLQCTSFGLQCTSLGLQYISFEYFF